MMLKQISYEKIQSLALSRKFKVNEFELKIIQQEFKVNTFVNLQKFLTVFDKYAIDSKTEKTNFFQMIHLRPDIAINDKYRADFFANIKNKTSEGYIYVLKSQKRIKTRI